MGEGVESLPHFLEANVANKLKEFKDALDSLIEIHKGGISYQDIADALEDAKDNVEAEADEAEENASEDPE